MNSLDLTLLPLWYLAFLFSIVCHEAAHALAGQLGGDDTAQRQVTINPIPHIQHEPVGTVLVPLISLVLQGFPIGWASAPYNPYWAIRYPKRAAAMALAGPLANFAIAICAAGLIHIGIAAGVFSVPANLNFSHVIVAETNTWSGAAVFLSILFSLNLFLGAFNLIPVPPLDGIAVLGLFIPEEYALKLQNVYQNPQFATFGMIVVWFIGPSVVRPAWIIGMKLLQII